jgi:hypothetical protein
MDDQENWSGELAPANTLRIFKRVQQHTLRIVRRQEDRFAGIENSRQGRIVARPHDEQGSCICRVSNKPDIANGHRVEWGGSETDYQSLHEDLQVAA